MPTNNLTPDPTPPNENEASNGQDDIQEDDVMPEGVNEEVRLRDLLPPEDELVDAPPMETLDESELPPEQADLADDAQEEQLSELDVQQLADRNMGDDQAMYGGDNTDYDREYYDNEDEYEYYDEQDTGYHPDQ